ncbi:MAG: hypothetical protein ACK4KU_00550 [Acinetobacter sp.]|uniref:hypothetical protein n=1 Tax=Acinetobacter sp. TaxID=472 RepID=UPI00391BBA44
MPNQIEHFFQNNENGQLELIQYKCKCGNFEEAKVVNGDYRLKKFHVYSVISDESHPLRYICNKCHVERKQVWNSETPLTP